MVDIKYDELGKATSVGGQTPCLTPIRSTDILLSIVRSQYYRYADNVAVEAGDFEVK